MNQIEYQAGGTGQTSQNSRVLHALQTATGDGWVSLPDLVRASGGYAIHSRVADLRKVGYRIEQQSVRAGKNIVHSFYRLTQ